MKIRELIEKLNKFNPESEVTTYDVTWNPALGGTYNSEPAVIASSEGDAIIVPNKGFIIEELTTPLDTRGYPEIKTIDFIRYVQV